MITLYGINNCDTIKKTRAWLDAQGADYLFHDYKKAGCPKPLAELLLKNLSLKELINTRGTTWRKLPESVRESLDRDSAMQLMMEQPSLIKRPLLNAGKQWLVGYDEDRMRSLLDCS